MKCMKFTKRLLLWRNLHLRSKCNFRGTIYTDFKLGYEYYLSHQSIQRHKETVHEFYTRLKEQGQKCGSTDRNQEIKRQTMLTTCNDKL